MKFAYYKLLSSILHLGNIEFEENNENNVCCVKDSSKIWFESCAELLGVDPNSLKNALLHRRLRDTMFVFFSHSTVMIRINILINTSFSNFLTTE